MTLGMKSQVDLLACLVRAWNVQEQCFLIRDQRLTIDVDDIYFLTGISCRGTDISLFGSRPSGGTTMPYLAEHCFSRSKISNRKMDIKTI